MKFKLLGLMLVVACIVSSCSTDESPFSKGNGKINPSLKTDYTISSSSSVNRSEGIDVITPEVNQFSLHLTKTDGSLERTWNLFNEFQPEDEYSAGAYRMDAFYGDENEEGFDKPYYYGSAEFNVYDSQSTPVSIVAELKNTMVSVEYTDAFKNYFADYGVKIHSGGGDYIQFAKDETRAAYVKSGTIAIEVSLTKTNGVSSTFEPAAISNAEPKTHYRIKLDVNGGEVGDAQLQITFDDTTEVEPVIIDLSDAVMNAPAPTIKATGYETSAPVEILEGDGAPHQLKAMVTAMSGLSAVTLTTQSDYLISKGWPAEINLLQATEGQKALLASYGLSVTGLWGNVDKMGIVDFTNVIKNLRVLDGKYTHSFTLQVKDKYSKVCQNPSVLEVNAPAVVLQLGTPENVMLGETSLVADMTYNGTNPSENIKMSTVNSYGVWENCTTTNVAKTGENTYKVTFTVKDASVDTRVRAIYKDNMKVSNEITYKRINPKFTISGSNATAYAKKMILGVDPEDDANLSIIMKYINVYAKSGSGDWKKMSVSTSGNIVQVSGLTPNTDYTFRATITPGANYSNEVAATTEEVGSIPNGDFESIASTISIASVNQGGKWSNNTNWTKRYTTTSINVSEPIGWASVNAKTCSTSASNKNTWFMRPSTFSISGAHSGSVAMNVRNVAWDLNGSEPSQSTNWSENYCTSAPSSIANRSVGKLFLGSYAFNASTGAETYNEGVSFASRPSSLSGYYQYANDGNDASERAVIFITLLNNETIIGKGEVKLGAAGSYTHFTVPVTYTVNAKATSLRIMIVSSDHASYTQSTESANVKTTNYISATQQESIGASLIVDNLTLSYE